MYTYKKPAYVRTRRSGTKHLTYLASVAGRESPLGIFLYGRMRWTCFILLCCCYFNLAVRMPYRISTEGGRDGWRGCERDVAKQRADAAETPLSRHLNTQDPHCFTPGPLCRRCIFTTSISKQDGSQKILAFTQGHLHLSQHTYVLYADPPGDSEEPMYTYICLCNIDACRDITDTYGPEVMV